MRSRRRAVGMCEITALGDFQGLWEGWETDSFIVGLPCFPSGRHFHRGRRHDFRFIVGPVKLPASLLIAELLAVGPYLRLMFDVLLCLTTVSAWPSRLFSTTAVWLTRWSLLKTR